MFCPGLTISFVVWVLSHWSGVRLGGLNERVVVGAALPRVEVWFFIKNRAIGITIRRNARLPRRKYLFLNIFMPTSTTGKQPAIPDDISVEDLYHFCK